MLFVLALNLSSCTASPVSEASDTILGCWARFDGPTLENDCHSSVDVGFSGVCAELVDHSSVYEAEAYTYKHVSAQSLRNPEKP